MVLSVKLKHFQKFADTTEALANTTAAVEGKLPKSLRKMLKSLYSEEVQDSLLVADAKLGQAIKEKMSIPCLSNSSVQELMRCIRSQADSLIGGLPKQEMMAMALGLAHSLSRYKLKFSPDKIDTMIVQVGPGSPVATPRLDFLIGHEFSQRKGRVARMSASQQIRHTI